MSNRKFSYFREPISNVIPNKSVTLEEVCQLIRTGLVQETESLRSKRTIGEAEYKEAKHNTLPHVTFGGEFDYRSNNPDKLKEKGKSGLVSSTGYIIIDIDHIEGAGLNLSELKDNLSSDQESGVRLVFTSPSGDGIKVVCKTASTITDNDSYRQVYDSLRYYLNSKYGDIVDKSGADITRSCLLCHDGDARLLNYTTEFSPELHPVPKKERERTLGELYNYPSLGDDGIEEIVRRVEESGKDIAPEYGEYLKLVYSFTSLGERGRGLLHRICNLHSDYKPEDVDKDFNNCIRSGQSQSIGTFVNMARDNGIDVTKPVAFPQRERRQTRADKPQQEQQKPEEKWRDYLNIPGLKDIASTKKEGIETRYEFISRGGKRVHLKLRAGALTLFCAKPSHCKSKFLQNLAIQIAEDIAKRGEDGSVLFFTYEEELSDVLCQFANIFANVEKLSQYETPNTEIIQDFFRTGNSDRCTKQKKSEIIPKLGGFSQLYESGRLRVFYTDLYAEDLCELIRYLSTQIKVKAVFVDYVQLLYMTPGRGRKQRYEELGDICNELRKTAIDLSIPLVLATQLSKGAENPTEMSSENVAEGYSLARYANTIVCLWLSSMLDDVKDSTSYLESKPYSELVMKGFELGKEGKLYAKVTKNRGGIPGLQAVLDYNGGTGRIEWNEDLPEEWNNLEYD